MKIYLIRKYDYIKGYYSFNRLLREEKILEICEQYREDVPKKDKLPTTIVFDRILIQEVEIDERI